jgi:acetyl esterase/lipase
MSAMLRFTCCLLFVSLACQAQDLPKPTQADVAYGTHAKQVLDFWKADTPKPAPLLFFTHGGGWMSGDKANPDFLVKCLEAGVSVVSINYRLIQDAQVEKIDPPVKACLDDAARALQFVRSRAAEWNLDKQRVVACGGSAGGFTSLWLGFHPDMADAKSSDPVARESTRVRGVMAFVPQTTLDPKQMQAWIPNNEYGNHAFGLPSMKDFVEKRDLLQPWIEKFSPYALATSDDPPVLLFYDNPPNLGQPYKDPPHCGNFGAGIAEKLKAVGIEHELNYNNDYGHMKWPDLLGFILEKLEVQRKP